MKVETILFDLDNTLLTNSMSTFVPRYFSLLSDYAAAHFTDKQLFLQALMLGTQAMMTREAGELTNREVFWKEFETRTGESAHRLEPFFDHFYETEFLRLQRACEMRAVARELVQYCFDRGLQVVIATNPLFPRRAVEHRLAWAGLPVESYNFALVTTYDNMHASKPSVDYYREILDRVDAMPDSALMVGDDWDNDIEPARALGIATYWIHELDDEHPASPGTDGHGSLDECYQWLRSNLQAGGI